jgi:hypothetical protein
MATNYRSVDDLNSLLDDCGVAIAAGKDAWPKAALVACEGAALGHYTADDADAIFGRIVRAANLAAVHERSEGGLKANISKLRQFLHVGAKFGTDTLERAAYLYGKLHASGADLKSAYPAYVDVARAQLKSDALLDDDAIEHAMGKGEAKASTAETKIKQALKAIEAAQKLRASEGERDLPELGDAASLLARALTMVEDERKHREWMASRPVARIAA